MARRDDWIDTTPSDDRQASDNGSVRGAARREAEELFGPRSGAPEQQAERSDSPLDSSSPASSVQRVLPDLLSAAREQEEGPANERERKGARTSRKLTGALKSSKQKSAPQRAEPTSGSQGRAAKGKKLQSDQPVEGGLSQSLAVETHQQRPVEQTRRRTAAAKLPPGQRWKRRLPPVCWDR